MSQSLAPRRRETVRASARSSAGPRLAWFVLTALVVALGLAARRWGAALPPFVRAYAPDALWALAVFLGLSCVAPRLPLARRAAAALVFAFAIEVSQLYHAGWIDRLRATRAGALVLGSGFLWSDLACYTAGVAAGVLLDRGLRRR